MITQTIALFVDAYRELNAKKLFWITMALSSIVVVIYAGFGLNEKGLTFLWWQFDTPMFTSSLLPPAKFYIWTFAAFGVPIWLTWAQTVLALVSTASIFPDFMSAGSIELLLCRPIGRVRLLLTKYLTGLLFVAMQVLAFALACFLVIGFRGGTWEPRLFLAVPIVVLFFSYMFAVCALLGLVTRSSIAALLLTILLWTGLFILNRTHDGFLQAKIGADIRLARAEGAVERASEPTEHQVRAVEEAEIEAAAWAKWHKRLSIAKAVLPKTTETIELLNENLLTKADTDVILSALIGSDNGQDREVASRVDDIARERSLAWILGSSLAFEGAILALTCVYFVRRDL